MTVTTIRITKEEISLLRELACRLDMYRLSGGGVGQVGSFPELVRRIGKVDPDLLAQDICGLLADDELPSADYQASVAGIDSEMLSNLRTLAAECGFFQKRGAGSGNLGNVSELIRRMAISSNEIEETLRGYGVYGYAGETVTVDGNEYQSYAQAARALDISRQVAWKRGQR